MSACPTRVYEQCSARFCSASSAHLPRPTLLRAAPLPCTCTHKHSASSFETHGVIRSTMDSAQVQVVDASEGPIEAAQLVKAWSQAGLQLHNIAVMFRTRDQVAEVKERLVEQSIPYIEDADELWNMGKVGMPICNAFQSEGALSKGQEPP
ncbi:hypothetical protein DUNSADRAFT_5628, partial [Dunaliella salina]